MAPATAPAPTFTYNFQEARVRCVKHAPYMQVGVCSMIAVPKPGLGTMAVDKHYRCYYDPAMFAEWSFDKTSAVILHEYLHLFLRHHQRCQLLLGESANEADYFRANIAMDLCVNQILRNFGTLTALIDADKDWLMPAKFKFPENLSFEEYYQLLLKNNIVKEVTIGVGYVVDGDGNPQDGAGTGPGKSRGHGHIGGSAADGRQRPWELGEPVDGDGLTPYEQLIVERQVAERIEKHKRSEGRGTLSSYLARAAADILRPQADPHKELAAVLRWSIEQARGSGDTTWRRRSRRQPDWAVRMPGSFRPVPRVAVLIDTSGSMGDDDLALGLGVVQHELKKLPSGVEVYAGDMDVKSAGKVFSDRQVLGIDLLGGGGTDMDRCLVTLAARRQPPQAIIVVTDGMTPWPAAPVGPLVVCCLTRPAEVPEWMRRVNVYRAKED